jgi:hypothetical protein
MPTPLLFYKSDSGLFDYHAAVVFDHKGGEFGTRPGVDAVSVVARISAET